jgi:hypothetical protein
MSNNLPLLSLTQEKNLASLFLNILAAIQAWKIYLSVALISLRIAFHAPVKGRKYSRGLSLTAFKNSRITLIQASVHFNTSSFYAIAENFLHSKAAVSFTVSILVCGTQAIQKDTDAFLTSCANYDLKFRRKLLASASDIGNLSVRYGSSFSAWSGINRIYGKKVRSRGCGPPSGRKRLHWSCK